MYHSYPVEILRGLKRLERFPVPPGRLDVVADLLVRVAEVQQQTPGEGQVRIAELLDAPVSIEEVLACCGEVALVVLDQPEHVADAREDVPRPGGLGQLLAPLDVLPGEVELPEAGQR